MTRRPIVDTRQAFEHLADQRLPGGCDDCDAYQTVTRAGGGLYVLTVHHDHTCPWLNRDRGADQ